MKKLLAFCATCLMVATGVTAQTYTFQSITGSVADAATGEAQLRMAVSSAGATQVNFRFFWEGTSPMSVTQIYFDDAGTGTGVLGSIASLNGVGGVNYGLGNGPPNVPGGNDPLVDFVTSTGLQAGAVAPPPHNGINRAAPDEYLDIVINLLGSTTFADVIAALNQGYIDSDNRGLRVGMHVQAFDGGGSASFVNNIVPLPPAAWAGMATLGGIVGLRAVRRRQISA